MLLQRAIEELRLLAFARSKESGFLASCRDCVARLRSHSIYTRLEGAVTLVEGGATEGIRLWNTPYGTLWAPMSERSNIVSCIGEQERG